MSQRFESDVPARLPGPPLPGRAVGEGVHPRSLQIGTDDLELTATLKSEGQYGGVWVVTQSVRVVYSIREDLEKILSDRWHVDTEHCSGLRNCVENEAFEFTVFVFRNALSFLISKS